MQIPKEWTYILETIRDFTGLDPILTGGALRDLDNGKEVKDLDFFVQCQSGMDFADKVKASLTNPHFDVARCYCVNEEYEDWSPLVTGVMTLQLEGWEVQIIGIKLPIFNMETVAARCDFGFCQIAWDGSEVYRSPWYQHDHMTKIATLRNIDCPTHLGRSIARFAKLTEKYPGYKPLVTISPDSFCKLYSSSDVFTLS